MFSLELIKDQKRKTTYLNFNKLVKAFNARAKIVLNKLKKIKVT